MPEAIEITIKRTIDNAVRKLEVETEVARAKLAQIEYALKEMRDVQNTIERAQEQVKPKQ